MGLITKFWNTLTTPEEWHPASIIAVGVVAMLALGLLFGDAFDSLSF